MSLQDLCSDANDACKSFLNRYWEVSEDERVEFKNWLKAEFDKYVNAISAIREASSVLTP